MIRNVDKLTDAIRNPRRGSVAVMPYLTAGYPDREAFSTLLCRVGHVADALEIGVPFSDPMADGVTIQESSRLALENGTTLSWILDTLRQTDVGCPFVLMSYLNPLLAYGLRRLCRDAAAAGASGLIVPDLPWEESAELRALAEAEGIGVVQLVTPVTPPDRLRMLCEGSRGFVYAVTVTGVTGVTGVAQAGADRSGLSAYLDAISSVSPVPVCAGFGIRGADDVAALAGHADGAIIGSAVIQELAAGRDAAAWVRALTT